MTIGVVCAGVLMLVGVSILFAAFVASIRDWKTGGNMWPAIVAGVMLIVTVGAIATLLLPFDAYLHEKFDIRI